MRAVRKRHLLAIPPVLAGLVVVLLGSCGDPTGPWIEESSHAIASLTSEDYTDLQFLKPLLSGRRLVQLGESGHGVAEFDAVKVRLIKFLHEEMGFDVIAFESFMYDCFVSNEDIDRLSPDSSMRSSIYGVWHTYEVLPLFEYIKATHQTERPLVLAGFDMKYSTSLGFQSRPFFFRDVIAKIDAEYAAQVEQVEQSLVDAYWDGQGWTSREERSSFYDQNGERLTEQYQALVEFFDLHESELIATYPDNPAIPLVARQTAWSTVQMIAYYLEFYPEQENTARMSAIRDSAMAINVEFLLERMYPGEKIVTWAHNTHIRHNDADVVYCDSCQVQPLLPNRMGTWLARWYRPELYTVGLYLNSGSAAWNSGEVYDIEPAGPNTMEAILHKAGLPYLFVDMLNQVRDDGNSWMFESVVTRAWGVNDERLVPRDQYDAILFIEEVHPPNYIN